MRGDSGRPSSVSAMQAMKNAPSKSDATNVAVESAYPCAPSISAVLSRSRFDGARAFASETRIDTLLCRLPPGHVERTLFNPRARASHLSSRTPRRPKSQLAPRVRRRVAGLRRRHAYAAPSPARRCPRRHGDDPSPHPPSRSRNAHCGLLRAVCIRVGRPAPSRRETRTHKNLRRRLLPSQL